MLCRRPIIGTTTGIKPIINHRPSSVGLWPDRRNTRKNPKYWDFPPLLLYSVWFFGLRSGSTFEAYSPESEMPFTFISAAWPVRQQAS